MLENRDLVHLLAEFLETPDLLKLQTHDAETKQIVADRLNLLKRADEFVNGLETRRLNQWWLLWPSFRNLIMERDGKSLDHKAARLAIPRLLYREMAMIPPSLGERRIVMDAMAKDQPFLDRLHQLDPEVYQRMIWFIVSRTTAPDEIVRRLDMRDPSWEGYDFQMDERPERIFDSLVIHSNLEQLQAIIDLMSNGDPDSQDPASAVVSFGISLLKLPSTSREARVLLDHAVELLKFYFPPPRRGYGEYPLHEDKFDELIHALEQMDYYKIHLAGQEDARDELLSILVELAIHDHEDATLVDEFIGNHPAPLTRKALVSLG